MTLRSRILVLLATVLVPMSAYAQGVPVKSGADSNLLTVTANKAALVSTAVSTRPTYIASAGAIACTTANNLIIESAAGVGFKLVSWCVNMSQATAAAAINIVVRRETSASTGGTALTNEGSGTVAISKMDPADANYTGIGKSTGTSGTAGATLDQVGLSISELGAGAADPAGVNFCRTYGLSGEKLPTVTAGTSNGIVISLTASGAGGLSSCALSATFIQE